MNHQLGVVYFWHGFSSLRLGQCWFLHFYMFTYIIMCSGCSFYWIWFHIGLSGTKHIFFAILCFMSFISFRYRAVAVIDFGRHLECSSTLDFKRYRVDLHLLCVHYLVRNCMTFQISIAVETEIFAQFTLLGASPKHIVWCLMPWKGSGVPVKRLTERIWWFL